MGELPQNCHALYLQIPFSSVFFHILLSHLPSLFYALSLSLHPFLSVSFLFT